MGREEAGSGGIGRDRAGSGLTNGGVVSKVAGFEGRTPDPNATNTYGERQHSRQGPRSTHATLDTSVLFHEAIARTSAHARTPAIDLSQLQRMHVCGGTSAAAPYRSRTKLSVIADFPTPPAPTMTTATCGVGAIFSKTFSSKLTEFKEQRAEERARERERESKRARERDRERERRCESQQSLAQIALDSHQSAVPSPIAGAHGSSFLCALFLSLSPSSSSLAFSLSLSLCLSLSLPLPLLLPLLSLAPFFLLTNSPCPI